MIHARTLIASVVALGLAAGFTGCTPTPAPDVKATKADGKAHDDHGHDHDHDHGHDHDHHAPGPHGGTIVDWGGGKYHVEFTVDHAAKSATVHVLDSATNKPLPIKTTALQLSLQDPPAQIELKPQPLDGETEALASRFVGTHDALAKEREFAGTISGEVEGTPYAADFKEESHAGHDHKGTGGAARAEP